MKKFISIVLLYIFAAIPSSALRDDPKPAITSKMKSAAEKYVKMILKEFPEKANGLSSSKARDKMYDELAKSGILTVDGATQVLLKRRKEVVKGPQMQTLIKNLAKDESKETKSLLTLANNDRLKGEGKLLVFRLLRKVSNAFIKKANQETKDNAEKKKTTFENIFLHYQTRIKELGRMPADLEELALPESLAKSDGKNWIYFGTRLNLGTEKGRVLLIDPNPNAGGSTMSLTDKGNVINLKHEDMMGQWNKVKDKPAPKPKSEKKPSPEPENKPEPAGVADEAYNKKVVTEFATAFKKIVEKRKATQIWPATLEEAGVEGDALTQDSPDGTEKKPWVYVASRAKLAVSKTQFIILAAPFPSKNNKHLIALSDGEIVSMTITEFKKVEAVLKDK